MFIPAPTHFDKVLTGTDSIYLGLYWNRLTFVMFIPEPTHSVQFYTETESLYLGLYWKLTRSFPGQCWNRLAMSRFVFRTESLCPSYYWNRLYLSRFVTETDSLCPRSILEPTHSVQVYTGNRLFYY